MRRNNRGQDRRSGHVQQGRAGKSDRGWGGRRHGLAGGAKTTARMTVVLTKVDIILLEKMRSALAVTGAPPKGSVTGGSVAPHLGRYLGDSGLERADGRWSAGEVLRLALRRLARDLGVEAPADGSGEITGDHPESGA